MNSSYSLFQKNNRVDNEPAEVLLAKKDWMGSSEDNNIMTKFQQKFEIRNNPEDFILSKDVEFWVNQTKKMSYMKLTMQLKKYCALNHFTDVDSNAAKNKICRIYDRLVNETFPSFHPLEDETFTDNGRYH